MVDDDDDENEDLHTRITIKVSDFSIIMCGDNDGLGWMAKNTIDSIVGIWTGIIISELCNDFASFRIKENCLQRIISGNKLIGILH